MCTFKHKTVFLFSLESIFYPCISIMVKMLICRHSSAVKQLQAGAGLQSKVDDAKNEWEDEMGKVEQTKARAP